VKDSHLQNNNRILKFSTKRRQPLLKVIVALAETPVAPWVPTALKYIKHRGFTFVGHWFFKIAYKYVINHYFVKY